MTFRAVCCLVLAFAADAGAEPVRFNRDVRPLLNTQCFKCHGGVKEAGGLNLQFRAEALLAGDSGIPGIVPGKPEESGLFQRLVTHDEDEKMPKKAPPLPPETVALLKQWIMEGANWEDHWAYQPPERAGKSIDEIVGARLQQAGLGFAPAAGVRTLARRLALDLTGLPPALEQVEALERTADPGAALVAFTEELLASPAYGERWAVPWLDLARYADSRGYEADRFRDMWPYRDWVVTALNADMPYDRFLTEQLAGDLLPDPTPAQLTATAFHRNTPQNDEGGTDDEEFRTYAVIDRVNTTFDALQGTSMGCVQCHGHPYDAFKHEEYYQLMAFFNNTADADRGDQAPTRKTWALQDAPQAEEWNREWEAVSAKLKRERQARREDLSKWLAEKKSPPAAHGQSGAAAPLPPSGALTTLLKKEESKWSKDEKARIEQYFLTEVLPESAGWYADRDRLEAGLKTLPAADLPIMQELSGEQARVTRVFHKGNWMDKGEKVQPMVPRILNPWPEGAPANRLGFAQWLTNGRNPLTARVQVNRVWEQIFGIGLVETLEDFGSQGDKPLHQDLLDELAVRFQTDLQWSQKALLREIVKSRVYRQSSVIPPALLERDPANRLLARGARYRLSNEQIRDQALEVSGLLSHKKGGVPVMPWQPPGTWLTPYEGKDWTVSGGEDAHRRALYTFIRRSAAYPSMITFDAPNREFCLVRRLRTNTPLQALDTLNSPVFMEAAAALAKRMESGGGTLGDQIGRGLLLATQRPGRDYEIAALRQLHTRTGGHLTLVANAILNLDEVLTRN